MDFHTHQSLFPDLFLQELGYQDSNREFETSFFFDVLYTELKLGES